VIGHVNRRDLEKVEEAFSRAAPDAARIVMIHHNPIRGELSGRHGLANTKQALRAFASLGAELILCGHDHQEAVHTVEEGDFGLVISTAGTISNRIRAGRPSSFNLVEIDESVLRVATYAWRNPGGFIPAKDHSFPRRHRSTASRYAGHSARHPDDPASQGIIRPDRGSQEKG
jgi:3',5'-cyclic AMP phosphodiesterase CpdA